MLILSIRKKDDEIISRMKIWVSFSFRQFAILCGSLQDGLSLCTPSGGVFFFPDEKSEVLEAEPQNKGMTS
jgi:hypothetical protein